MSTARKRGRPPADNPLERRLLIRLTADDAAEVEDRARQQGQTVTQWLRAAILRALKSQR